MNFRLNYKKTILSLLILFGVILLAPNLALAAETSVSPSAELTTNDTVPADSEHADERSGHETEEPSGIVGMFGLNWKLLLAQLINFGIVLFVLWKWVFGPVTKGLADRTAKIESGLAEAEKINKDRENFDSWKEGEISKVRVEATTILTQAKSDAESLKAQTLEQTKLEQRKIQDQAIKSLEQEKVKAIDETKQHLADLVTSATEIILRAKLDPQKDGELITEALNKAEGSNQ